MQLWSEGESYSKQMGFEFGFKMWERVDVTKVRREGVPELGSRAAESSAPHSKQGGQGEQWDGMEEEDLCVRAGVAYGGGQKDMEGRDYEWL